MGKRYYRRKQKLKPMQLLALFGIILVVVFWKIILVFALITLGVIAAIFFIKTTIILYRKHKMKKDYLRTQYYSYTLIPYKIIHNKKGIWFEIICYDKIKKEFGDDCKLLVNTIIPRIDSINEFSEIDLILFHKTGIYVLELKDYNGYVYGKKENKNWTVGYPADKKKNNKRKVYEFLNPIKQNQVHINDLKKIGDYNYHNYVIFSENITFNSYMQNVMQIDQFIEAVKSSTEVSPKDYEQIEKAFDILKTYDLSNDQEIKNQHIMRIKYNEMKYKS